MRFPLSHTCQYTDKQDAFSTEGRPCFVIPTPNGDTLFEVVKLLWLERWNERNPNSRYKTWGRNYQVRSLCGDPLCINPRHIYPGHRCAELRDRRVSDKIEKQKQSFYQKELTIIRDTLMQIEQLKISVTELPEAELEDLIRKHREDRRAQYSSNKTAAKIRTATGGTVTKKAMLSGQSMDSLLKGLSKKDLELLKTKLGG